MTLAPSPSTPPDADPIVPLLVYFLYPETANLRLEEMGQLFGDATTAMPTPAQQAEVESLMGNRSPVPSLDIRRGAPGNFGADHAIPGLDINPPAEDAKPEEGKPEGIGGWISRIRRMGSTGSGKTAGSGTKGGEAEYRRLGQDEE